MRLAIAVAFAFAALALPGASAAAPIRCVVPKVETCPGCLRKVQVRPLPGGACRVSFEVSPEALRPGSGESLVVEIEPPPRAAAARRARSRPRVAYGRSRPLVARSDRCFRFNGQSFCE